ncbi:hypothetical protein ACOSQ2_030730 [Xanthoceras sorbifolium]
MKSGYQVLLNPYELRVEIRVHFNPQITRNQNKTEGFLFSPGAAPLVCFSVCFSLVCFAVAPLRPPVATFDKAFHGISGNPGTFLLISLFFFSHFVSVFIVNVLAEFQFFFGCWIRTLKVETYE